MKVCVLLSGGMDSVVAFYEALRTHEVVACLSFDYGSKHNSREIPFAKLHADRNGVIHHTITLGFMNQLFKSDLLKSGGAIPDGHYAELTMKQTVVPFRNGIMLAIATGYAESIEAEGLVIAAHSGDHAIYPDCREPFMQAMATAMSEGTYAKIQLCMMPVTVPSSPSSGASVMMVSSTGRKRAARSSSSPACTCIAPWREKW